MRLVHRLRSLPLTPQIAFAAGFVALVVTIAFAFSFVAVERLRDAGDDAQRAEAVVSSATAAEKLLLDLETAQRGYVITHDGSFLEPWRSARRELPQEEARLRRVLAGDAAAQAQVDRLVRGVDAYVRRWAEPLVRVAARDPARARRLVAAGEGKRRVDRLRAEFDTLVAGRDRLAAETRARADDAGRLALEVGIGSLVAILLLVLGIVAYFTRSAVIPVARVAAATTRVAGGDLSARVSGEGVGEVAVLAQGFNSMAAALEENRATLEREQRRAESLYLFGERLAATSEVEPLAEVILSGIAELMDFDCGAMYVVGQDGRTFERSASHGVDAERLPQRVAHDERRELLAAAAPELHAVFSHGGETLGFLALARSGREAPTAEEVTEVERLADQSAVALAHVLALRRTRRLLDVNRAVLDSTREGITMVDPSGRLVFSNRTMEELYGNFGVPASGSVWERLAATAGKTTTPERYLQRFAQVIADPELVYEDDFTIAESGRSFHGVTAPVRDSSGRLIGRLFSLRETSAEREADRLKDEFVATVSHELRTPLTSMFGFMEVLLDGDAGELNDEQRRFLEIVQRSTERLMRLVGDLLFIGQIDSGRLSLQTAPTDLRELAEEVVEAARATARLKEIDLLFNAEPLPPVEGDRSRLVQLTDNLLSNALKFTPEGGRVEVSLRMDGDARVLEISDSGLGIPRVERSRLFERFFRSTAATEHAIPGTGLGLAISKAIVEAHGGTIALVDRDGPGATFRVILPGAARGLTST